MKTFRSSKFIILRYDKWFHKSWFTRVWSVKRIKLLRDMNVSLNSFSHFIIIITQEYCSIFDVMTSSTDITIQCMLLYQCLCWMINFFVNFWTKEISSSFKSSHNYVDFYTCNPDFFSTRNWKVLKTWRLNKIDSSSKLSWFIISFIFVLSLIANSASAIKFVAFFIFVFSSLSISIALSVSNLTTASLSVLNSITALLLESDSVPVSALELLLISSAELDSSFSTSESHAGFLLISTYCQVYVLNKSWSLQNFWIATQRVWKMMINSFFCSGSVVSLNVFLSVYMFWYLSWKYFRENFSRFKL